MTRAPAGVLALLLAACAAQAPEPSASMTAPGAPADGRTVGVVRVVGSAPVNVSVVLRSADGRSIELTGPFREELRSLGGAEVAVSGPITAAPDPLADRRIAVEDYEILAVGGEPVLTGTVEGRSGDWVLLRTRSGELVYLGGAADELQAGQKVWVQGPSSVIVQSHGVLRR